MKKRMIAAVALVFAAIIPVFVFAQDDIREHRDCAYCGMDRKAYGYSRMMVVYEDGAEVGVCSLHCAAIELDKNPGRRTKAIMTADRDTRKLIDAEKAYWVIGGKKRGVMTQNPKWAFETKAAADAFSSSNGGKPATWAEALAAARVELSR